MKVEEIYALSKSVTMYEGRRNETNNFNMKNLLNTSKENLLEKIHRPQ